MRPVPPMLALVLALPAIAAASETPRLVAPGEADRFAPVGSPCPSFSWTHTAGAEGFELIVSSVDEQGEVDEVALTRRLPPGSTSWTPAADACLAPGAYAWMIRTLRSDHFRWSEASLFRVPEVPDRVELERALAVVRRYLEARSEPADETGREVAREAPASEPGRTIAPHQPIALDLTTTAAAIRGELAATTGAVHGVVGISNSIEGAGVAADNSAGGADLVLGGTVPARITENRWELDSGSASTPTFEFSNPSGGLSLRVNGPARQAARSDLVKTLRRE